ncbi:ATP synthase subunit f, mitochondrial-like [Mesocricetus auratus]|uniref:ATP synthase F(0) complex subunit f, mitochondrial n=1 Tax=Mesocricetus auratus TaxID=10036 RepID=A0ABM2W5T8_MESAU|nr:ATP synthase subunit f, mitochondrial-like [Mesocricetus auratus]
MATRVPLEQKLMDIELPSWILVWDFTPSGTVGICQRVYYQGYKKYMYFWKGSIVGLSMVLVAYLPLSYCIPFKELKHKWRPASTSEDDQLSTNLCCDISGNISILIGSVVHLFGWCLNYQAVARSGGMSQ